jgi:hypothetical protein
VQLPGDRADRPELGVVQPQDVGAQLRGGAHGCPFAAGSPGANGAAAGAGNVGTATIGARRARQTLQRRRRELWSWHMGSVKQLPLAPGNPGASRSRPRGPARRPPSERPGAHAISASARRVPGGHASCAGSVAWPRGAPVVLGGRTHGRSSAGHGRSGCKTGPGRGSVRTGTGKRIGTSAAPRR